MLLLSQVVVGRAAGTASDLKLKQLGRGYFLEITRMEQQCGSASRRMGLPPNQKLPSSYTRPPKLASSTFSSARVDNPVWSPNPSNPSCQELWSSGCLEALAEVLIPSHLCLCAC